jgi:multidrug resistance efflux pump
MARVTEKASDAIVVSASGWVEGATKELRLQPALAERVVAIPVSEGQYVATGDPLLRLDETRYRHEMELADSELQLALGQQQRLKNGARAEERAEARSLYRAKVSELEQAQRTWNRTSYLLAKNAVARQAAEDDASDVRLLWAEAQAAKARVDLLEASARPDDLRIVAAKVNTARAKLQLARARLEKATLTSPISGEVLQINVEPGELVDLESTEPSVVMADTSRFRVRAFVEEVDATRVCEGMVAEVRADGLPDRVFRGCLSRVSPRMSRKQLWTHDPAERYDTKVREVWIELNDARDLVVGLRVDVVIKASATISNSTKLASRQAMDDTPPSPGRPGHIVNMP